MTCETCGATLKADARFCGTCGAPVAASGDGAAPQKPAAKTTPAAKTSPAAKTTPIAKTSAAAKTAATAKTPAPEPAAVEPAPVAADEPAVEEPAAAAAAPAPLVAPWTLRRKLTVGGIAASALLVVAGLAVGIGFVVSGAAGGGAGVDDASPPDSSVDDGPVAVPSSDSEDPADGGTETQAPTTAGSGGSVDAFYFQSKSGNIRCTVTPDLLICRQGEIKYAVPAQNCSNSLSGTTVGLTQTGPTWPCLTRDFAGGEVLPYDTPIDKRGYRCEISFATGVTCTNQAGQGFNMEYKSGVRMF